MGASANLPMMAGFLQPMPRGMRHGLTLASGLTHHLLPWPAGTRTRCRMGQMKSAGRNRTPRGMKAAESAKGETLGSSNHSLSQEHGSCGPQEKEVQRPALTHLPAAVPVGQEPKHYAEDHVAKKHHLREIETQLRRAHSQQNCAALLWELRGS